MQLLLDLTTNATIINETTLISSVDELNKVHLLLRKKAPG